MLMSLVIRLNNGPFGMWFLRVVSRIYSNPNPFSFFLSEIFDLTGVGPLERAELLTGLGCPSFFVDSTLLYDLMGCSLISLL